MKTHAFIGRIENKRAHIDSCCDVGTIKGAEEDFFLG